MCKLILCYNQKTFNSQYRAKIEVLRKQTVSVCENVNTITLKSWCILAITRNCFAIVVLKLHGIDLIVDNQKFGVLCLFEQQTLKIPVKKSKMTAFISSENTLCFNHKKILSGTFQSKR